MTKPFWRFIDSGYQTGAMNMAIDEALLEAVAGGSSAPVLRVYCWKPATLTLGYAQSIHKDVDFDFCQANDIDVVRRSTGGRAVLHDHEMTYAVIAPLQSGAFGATVLDCYKVIAEVLQRTLVGFGLPAKLVAGKSAGGQGNPTRAVCFSAPSQYELVIDGCKVVGSAQRRQGAAFLQHGSVPVDMDLDLLSTVLRVDPAKKSETMSKVGWLQRWSTERLTVEALEAALADTFQSSLDVDLDVSDLTVDEKTRSRDLFELKFNHPDWTMSR